MFFLGLFGIAVLVGVGLFIALLAVATFWTIVIVFSVVSVLLAFLISDPYLRFFVALPVTALAIWVLGKLVDRSPSDQT